MKPNENLGVVSDNSVGPLPRAYESTSARCISKRADGGENNMSGMHAAGVTRAVSGQRYHTDLESSPPNSRCVMDQR